MDIRYHGLGNLVAITPLTDRAREFIAAQWPKGTPDIIPDTDGGRLMGREAFQDALVAIADAGLEAASRDELPADGRWFQPGEDGFRKAMRDRLAEAA